MVSCRPGAAKGNREGDATSALRASRAVLTPDEADAHLLRTLPSDTEDAPWMVRSDRQWRNAGALYWSLAVYAQQHPVPWHPGGMLPVTYRPPGARRRRQVAPDVFASVVPVAGRDALPVEEGMPPFVLEVVSAASVRRDREEKRELYRVLGAREYALVRLDLAAPRLEGYWRDERGDWSAWEPDADGRLWSGVLGLGLLLREGDVRALTREGVLLPTPEEEAQACEQAEAARDREAQAREQAKAARDREAQGREQAEAARAEAEAEAARLRAALERLTGQGGGADPRWEE